jgi:hypothetical protein
MVTQSSTTTTTMIDSQTMVRAARIRASLCDDLAEAMIADQASGTYSEVDFRGLVKGLGLTALEESWIRSQMLD